MPKAETILLTGITGTAGSRFGAQMLRSGCKLLALMRDTTADSARQRIDRILAISDADAFAGGVEILRGDVCQPELGIDSDDCRLNEVGRIIHCTACVEFIETTDGLVRRTNVEGTRNALALARRLRVPFVHVSTAYVAGTRQGVVRADELDLGQGFNNDYERTKCEAEALARRWGEATGLPLVILRPSIIVGDSATGATVNFNTLYDFMQLFERLAPILGGDELRVDVRS